MKVEVVKRKSRKGSRTARKAAGSVSISKLKKELDSLVSRYVRQFWAKDGICYCYTCNKPLEIKKAHCGHFVPRIYLATRWELDNLRPQCPGCNLWGNGQLLDFEENLIEEIGFDRVQQLKEKRNEIWRLTPQWYTDQITLYQNKLKDLDSLAG